MKWFVWLCDLSNVQRCSCRMRMLCATSSVFSFAALYSVCLNCKPMILWCMYLWWWCHQVLYLPIELTRFRLVNMFSHSCGMLSWCSGNQPFSDTWGTVRRFEMLHTAHSSAQIGPLINAWRSRFVTQTCDSSHAFSVKWQREKFGCWTADCNNCTVSRQWWPNPMMLVTSIGKLAAFKFLIRFRAITLICLRESNRKHMVRIARAYWTLDTISDHYFSFCFLDSWANKHWHHVWFGQFGLIDEYRCAAWQIKSQYLSTDMVNGHVRFSSHKHIYSLQIVVSPLEHTSCSYIETQRHFRYIDS